MAKSLEELMAQIQKNQQAYTPLTQQQMQEQATNRYKPVYDQKKLSAQQAFDTSDQALAQQLAGLQANYDKQRQQSRENTALTYSAADRQSLGRGMQRSSYNNATLANINLKGNEALQAISDTQAAQEKYIGEQRALMSQQLASQLAQYDAAQQAEILAYIDELQAREYDRAQQANQLAMQLYEYNFQKQQADREQANWQAQYNAQYGGSSSGGSKKSSSSSSNNSKSGSLWDELGGSSKAATIGTIAGGLATALGVVNALKNKK
jgi:hypothetical protein